jgi:hypothetical protein
VHTAILSAASILISRLPAHISGPSSPFLRMPETHPLDLSPLHVSSLSHSFLHFCLLFSLTAKPFVFRAILNSCSSLLQVRLVVM